MTGIGQAMIARSMRSKIRCWACHAASVMPFRCLRSPPAQNALVPRPVRIAILRPSISTVSPSNSSMRSHPIWVFKAFAASGRFKVTNRMPLSRRSTTIVSKSFRIGSPSGRYLENGPSGIVNRMPTLLKTRSARRCTGQMAAARRPYVSLSHPRIIEQIAGSPRKDNPTVLHDIGEIGDVERDIGELFDQQYRAAFGAQSPDDAIDFVHEPWRQAHRGLVQ